MQIHESSPCRGPRGHSGHRKNIAILCASLLGLLMAVGPGFAESAKHTALKAQFITRIAQFVEWPEGSFESETSPIRIGVLGESDLTDALSSEAATAKAGKRAFVVETLADIDDAPTVHIVVVPKASKPALAKVARALKGSGTLSFGPSFTFAENGGTLGIEIYRGRVAFEVNRRAANDANLRISSKVLKLATNVY